MGMRIAIGEPFMGNKFWTTNDLYGRVCVKIEKLGCYNAIGQYIAFGEYFAIGCPPK